MTKFKVKITNSGGKKVGKVYEINDDGEEVLVGWKKSSTRKHLSRALRNEGLIPSNVHLNKKVTYFWK